jgi:hypothetical protein
MTNKISPLITELEKRLSNAGIAKTIRYPEQIGEIGNLFPMAIIEEGIQSYIATPGNQYEYTVPIRIGIVSDVIHDRIEYMNDLQAAIFNQLFPSATLDGLVMNINPVTVDPDGGTLKAKMGMLSGFVDAAAFREITIECMLCDARR